MGIEDDFNAHLLMRQREDCSRCFCHLQITCPPKAEPLRCLLRRYGTFFYQVRVEHRIKAALKGFVASG